jgi:branched-chain amino acid transport system substrate-binding protein
MRNFNRLRHIAMLAFGAALASLLGGQARADMAKGTLKIGVLSDFSNVYADIFGEGSLLAARMAVESVGGKVAGLPVEIVFADHQNSPDIGSTTARKWFDADGVDAIVDVPTSSVALAVASLAQSKDKVFMPTGAFSAELTGKSCSPNTVHWTIDNWALANSIGRLLASTGAKKWYFITADFAFGYDLERISTDAVQTSGGTVLGHTRLPLGTTDFSSALLSAQTSRAEVIGLANAGPDMNNSIKGAAEFGLAEAGQKIAAFALGINNVKGLGLSQAAGLLAATPFYWDLNDATRAWSKAFQERHPKHAMPNEMQAGVYANLIHYFKAIEATKGETSGRAIVQGMEKLPTDDPLFGPGRIRADGRAIHPLYLVQVKSAAESKFDWDYFKVVGSVPADEAFRPLEAGGCPLVKAN